MTMKLCESFWDNGVMRTPSQELQREKEHGGIRYKTHRLYKDVPVTLWTWKHTSSAYGPSLEFVGSAATRREHRKLPTSRHLLHRKRVPFVRWTR